ncbi:MAG: ABC transporter permease subunit [Acidimicrobiales bacterium]
MTATAPQPTHESQVRPPFYRDVRVLRVAGQVVAVVAVLALLRWLIGNLLSNLDEQNISTDFSILRGPTNFAIRDDPGFDDRSPIFPNMLWVGIKNTAISAVVGIVIAVVLGTLIGIGRLSTNWVVNRLSMLYVEVMRNIPPLIIIIFFGFAIFTFGPFPPFNPRNPPWEIGMPFSDGNLAILSNDRWGVPSLASDGNVGIFWLLMLVALAAAVAVWRWRTAINVRTGEPHRRAVYGAGTLLGLAVIASIVTARPYRLSLPAVSESGRVIEGGFATNAGYLSLTLALGLYTASHVAEIIRGSILAVPKGQTEAANALALSGFQRYRFVVLPQALRIAIPPIINQFLNLTKNTSLGTAVAYPELTALTKTAIGNGRPAVQMLLILMIIYLLFSLTWSVLLNLVNRRFQLAGR